MELNDIISSGLLELHAMGLANAEETAQVEQWVSQSAEVRAEIEAIQSSMEGYAMAHALQPDVSVKAELMKKISGEGNDNNVVPLVDMKASPAKVRAISPAWRYAAAASILLLIGSAILNYNYYNKYNSASDKLAATQSELQQQKDLAQGMHNDMDMMRDPNATPVSLSQTKDGAGMARVFWVKNTGVVYVDPSNLPMPPAGKQYQFWGIVDGVPVSGGMIKTRMNGKEVHVEKMKSFGRVEAFAVSLEDAGPEKAAPTKVVNAGSPI